VLLWSKILGWLGFQCATGSTLEGWFLQFRDLLFGKGMKRKGMVIWHATVWSIWLCRNAAIFKEEEVNINHTADLVEIRSWNWFYPFKLGIVSFSGWNMAPLSCLRTS
jgi:hypothetical protein